jgi:hypothetical protein
MYLDKLCEDIFLGSKILSSFINQCNAFLIADLHFINSEIKAHLFVSFFEMLK